MHINKPCLLSSELLQWMEFLSFAKHATITQRQHQIQTYAVDGISGDSYKHAVDLGDCGEHVSAISEIIIWRTPYNYLASAI